MIIARDRTRDLARDIKNTGKENYLYSNIIIYLANGLHKAKIK